MQSLNCVGCDLRHQETDLKYQKTNSRRRALARRAGYEAAVMAGSRMNTRRTDPFRLKRIGIDYRMTIAQLRWKLFRLRWLSFA